MEKSLDWIKSTNIYEVNIRQYTKEGTFKAFENDLPRLKKMGIETLWFMPITPISQLKKKGTLGSPYATSDYLSINPEFGTMEDFKHLVDEAHKKGFKVILDWVANHTGWNHVWTSTNPDFYKKNIDGKFLIASGMDDIIELDFSNIELRKAMTDAMKYWLLEANIDGFRCDLASWVDLSFWEQARAVLEKLKPLFFLGEFDEFENPEYGKVFDASYSWKWMHLTRDFYQNNLPISDLKNLLDEYSKIGNDSMRAWFTSNHDENSWNGTEYEKYGDFSRALAVFSVVWNGIPLIYNGQEIPMKAKRLKFFDKDQIPWNGICELENFYKILLNLKFENPAARGGDSAVKNYWINTTYNNHVLCFLRKKENREILVIINASKNFVEFQLKDDKVLGSFKNVFSGKEVVLNNDSEISLDAFGYLVFEK